MEHKDKRDAPTSFWYTHHALGKQARPHSVQVRRRHGAGRAIRVLVVTEPGAPAEVVLRGVRVVIQAQDPADWDLDVLQVFGLEVQIPASRPGFEPYLQGDGSRARYGSPVIWVIQVAV